jgi:hypothetical protein
VHGDCKGIIRLGEKIVGKLVGEAIDKTKVLLPSCFVIAPFTNCGTQFSCGQMKEERQGSGDQIEANR